MASSQVIDLFMTQPLAVFSILLAVSFAGIFIYRVVLDPLRDIPGPVLARFTRLWEVWQHWHGSFEKVNIDLHRKYGPVVRIGPGRYSISDRVAAKKIYGHGSKFVKGKFYHAFGFHTEPEKANLFQDQNEAQHAQNRRKVASLYSMSSLLAYEPFVDKCTALLSSKLEHFARRGDAITTPAWTQFYAFDVISEITVGQSFGMMVNGADHTGILEQIHFANSISSFIGLLPEWNVWIRRITLWLRLRGTFAGGGMIGFINAQLEARKSGKAKSDRADFLTKLLRMQDEGGKGIDEYRIMDTVAANVGAGSDTTGLSLAAMIYYLEKNPECKRILREEIDRMETEGKLSNPITFKEAQDMPYLQSVIKEALRMHPATGLIMPRIVPEEGAELCGRFFPAGTEVGINSWVLHANESIFGTDAHIFRPSRWLGPKEEVSVMNENMFAFGAGARTCIGKNISLLEMTKVIPQIYRQYDFELLEREWKTENRWFVKQHFTTRIHPRKSVDLLQANGRS